MIVNDRLKRSGNSRHEKAIIYSVWTEGWREINLYRLTDLLDRARSAITIGASSRTPPARESLPDRARQRAP